MNPPTYQKQVQTFIGVINYYFDMWPSQSHTLAPLTRLASIKWKFKWTQVEQCAFKKTNYIMANNTLFTYLGFNETFKIHTNASVFQFGAFFIQKG